VPRITCERVPGSPALLFVIIIQGESLRTRLTWPNMYNVLLSIRHHPPKLVALILWPYTGNWGISGGRCSFENRHPFVRLWYILVVWNEMYQTLPTYNPQFRCRFVAGHFKWRWIARLCRKKTNMFGFVTGNWWPATLTLETYFKQPVTNILEAHVCDHSCGYSTCTQIFPGLNDQVNLTQAQDLTYLIPYRSH